MSAIIRPESYAATDDSFDLVVTCEEGVVHLDCRGCDEGFVCLDPADARLLAAILNHYAEEAQR